MALSNDLLSQFAKITNDNNEQPTEKTVYGTIVVSGENKYVRLDGSNIDTPISMTTDASHGDRVTVLIKNHSAVVTGNITSPSAKKETVDELGDKTNELSDQVTKFGIVIADKVSTEQLTAESARIEQLVVTGDAEIRGELTAESAEIRELVAKKATIKQLEAVDAKFDNLDATYAKISVLESDYATIENLNATNATVRNLSADHASFKETTTEKLSANDASIKNLQTDKLSATEADLKYATIENLNATNANVGNLSADVADIDTLIFGSASGDTIQTSFANAVIAQLGNAQIKSAMIDNVSADKISAGTISTANVQIQSDDGRMVISDETIQISDSNRVRVQIGKDASNDYSINIWDETGKLMFSKGGITDAAIKDAIIRNDMVANDANISASKLDISSLFTEINGSTETIKSSKIYMDADKQTLDVSFTQMNSDISEAQAATSQNASDIANLATTVTSQGTDISVIQGQISSKIWQQDIATATEDLATDEEVSELNTKYSSLEQTVDGISTTVANHTTLIAKKADSSTVTTVSNKVSELETSLNGFKSTVSDTYATKTSLENTQDDLDAVTERVSSAETAIQQNKDAIALRATKTELTTTLGGYYTKDQTDAAIEVSADNITQSVSKTYATQASLSVTNSNVTNAQKAADAAQDDVDALAVRVTSAETAIDQNADAISLRATKTELNSVSTVANNAQSTANGVKNDLASNYYTKTQTDAQITTTSESISLRVSEETVKRVEIGGRNLVLDSDAEVSSEGYLVHKYSLSEDWSVGQEYTVTIKGTVNDGQKFGVWMNGSSVKFAYLEYDADRDIHYATYTPTTVPTTEPKTLCVYNYPSSTATEASAEWIKLEKGNKATDWTPAPEDTDSAIQDGITESQNAAQNYVDNRLGDYVSNSSLENYKVEVESKIEQSADSVTTTFETRITNLEGENDSLSDDLKALYKRIKLSTDGITISSGDDTTTKGITLRLDNDAGIQFWRTEELDVEGAEPFGHWDGTNFYTGNIVVRVEERAQFGNFAYLPRSDGSLSFLKVGG